MRFFTPELLRRFRSRDEDIAEAASEEWEGRLDAYAEHRKALRHEMPNSARRAMRSPTLHDAEMLGFIGEKEGPVITMMVRLEGRDGSQGPLLLFRYHAATHDSNGSISVERHDIGAKGDPKKHKVRILYDEFDKAEGGTFTHSVLLSNGLLFRVHFRDVSARVFEPVKVPESLGAGLPNFAFA